MRIRRVFKFDKKIDFRNLMHIRLRWLGLGFRLRTMLVPVLCLEHLWKETIASTTAFPIFRSEPCRYGTKVCCECFIPISLSVPRRTIPHREPQRILGSSRPLAAQVKMFFKLQLSTSFKQQHVCSQRSRGRRGRDREVRALRTGGGGSAYREGGPGGASEERERESKALTGRERYRNGVFLVRLHLQTTHFFSAFHLKGRESGRGQPEKGTREGGCEKARGRAGPRERERKERQSEEIEIDLTRPLQ